MRPLRQSSVMMVLLLLCGPLPAASVPVVWDPARAAQQQAKPQRDLNRKPRAKFAAPRAASIGLRGAADSIEVALAAGKTTPRSGTSAALSSEAQYAAPVAFAKHVSEANGFTFLIFLNAAYMDLTLNWICNVRALGNVLPNTAFVCGDPDTTKALLEFDPSLHAFTQAYAQKGSVSYGTYEYFRLTVERLRVQNAMIQQGASIMVVEADAAWLPRAADVQTEICRLLQTHEIVSANDGESSKQISAGFLAIRSTAKMRTFFQRYVDFYEKHLETMNKLVVARLGTSKNARIGNVGEQATMTTMLKSDNVAVKWLSHCAFSASGLWYSKHPYRRKCPNPRVIQNNFIFGNDAKQKRAKRFKHWYLDERRHACLNTNASAELSQKQ
jgi:hypothetical protein